MPIVYIHGASVRDDAEWEDLELLLRQYIAPKIANDPENVQISRCYWGDFGARFRWQGASTPPNPLKSQMDSLLAKGAETLAAAQSKAAELLSGQKPLNLEELASRLKPKPLQGDAKELGHQVEESLARGVQGAGFLVTRAAMDMRPPMNKFITSFIGDVLTYVHERGDCKAPGWIPSKVLSALAQARDNQKTRAAEPIIVLSHSMGGQIMFDAITHFLPNCSEYEGIRVDFWAATASQIGLFEELKLFLESSEEYSSETKVPRPFPDNRYLGCWWNVWDYNDFLSYSVKGIIDGADDEPFDSGMFVTDAHGGYLIMPSFFRKFAAKVEQAKQNGWRP